MAKETTDCVYCHRTLAKKRHADPVHPYVCDDCLDCIRARRPRNLPAGDATPAAPTDERKLKPRKRSNTRALATGLLLLLALTLATSCGATWAGSLQVELDPATLLDQRQQTREALLEILRSTTPEISTAPTTE